MKMKLTCALMTVLASVAILIPSCKCNPGGQSGSSGYGGSYGSGDGGYSGGYGARPKSSAVDAVKSLYNNQDGYNYDFGYDIQDSMYNNYQSQQESGDPKGVTKGSYSVVEPDGSRRTVNYVADWVNGFRATVSDKNGLTQHGYNSGGYGGGDASPGYGGSSGGHMYSGGSGYYPML